MSTTTTSLDADASDPSATSPALPGQGRITLIDSLRGLALLGLFLVHCVEYFELYWRDPQQSKIFDAVFFLFAGKAYAAFAMLFGVSFFIIMDRQRRRGVDFSSRFVWRLFLLVAMGYLYSLLYSGDILQVLGVFGLLLLLFDRLGNRALLALSLVFLLQPHLLLYASASLLDVQSANAPPLHWGLYAGGYDLYANGSFWDVVRFNAWQGQLAKWAFIVESSRLASFACLFIWGLLLGRIGFFSEPGRFVVSRRLGLVVTFAASVLIWRARTAYDALPPDVFQAHGNAKMHLGNVLGAWHAIAMMAFGVLSIVELYRLRAVRRLLALVAPSGQMSLTMYVAQGVVCIPLFYGYGLGWHESIGQGRAVQLGLATFGVLALFAYLWMRQFRYGPLEWLWRCGTYLTFQVPLRRRPDVRPAVTPVTAA